MDIIILARAIIGLQRQPYTSSIIPSPFLSLLVVIEHGSISIDREVFFHSANARVDVRYLLVNSRWTPQRVAASAHSRRNIDDDVLRLRGVDATQRETRSGGKNKDRTTEH